MDKTGGLGSMIGGGISKVLGGVKGAVKNYGPIAGLQAGIGAYGLKNQYDADLAAEAQQAAHPQRKALASVPGSSTISRLRQDLMPKLGGDKTMANSLVTVLDQYLERERAFEWGVEQFCKKAGFDADDAQVMMKLVKEAGLPGAMARSRGFKPVRGGAGRPSPFTNLTLQPVPKSTYTPQAQVAPGAAAAGPASVSQRLRDSMARKRRRTDMAAGVGGESQPQQQASGGPQPDGSWLPWAAMLGGGYLAHGYGTEGGTYSMFDPPEVKAQKQKNRNAALGIKDPAAAAPAAAPGAKGTVNFENDTAGRNRTMMENYLKQLEVEGPDDPVTAARQLYGGVGQPSSMNNLNYFLEQQPEFRPRLEKMYGNERSQQILSKLRGQTTGQPGVQ